MLFMYCIFLFLCKCLCHTKFLKNLEPSITDHINTALLLQTVVLKFKQSCLTIINEWHPLSHKLLWFLWIELSDGSVNWPRVMISSNEWKLKNEQEWVQIYYAEFPFTCASRQIHVLCYSRCIVITTHKKKTSRSNNSSWNAFNLAYQLL